MASLYTKKQIMDWPDDKRLAFCNFATHFIEGKGYRFDVERVAMANLTSEFVPFINKIGVEGKTMRECTTFKLKFIAMSRTFFTCMKQNPQLITEEMAKVMGKTERFRWALETFVSRETPMGTVVERQTDEMTDPNQMNAQPSQSEVKTPEVLFSEAIMKIAATANQLLVGIPQAEIKKMDAYKRIQLATTVISSLGSLLKKNNPKTVIFKQVNVNKAKRQELEDAMREYAEQQL